VKNDRETVFPVYSEEQKNMSSFEEHLRQKAEEFGFGEPKKTDWVKYMRTDQARGEELISVLKERFNLSPGRKGRALDIGCGYGGQVAAFSGLFHECCGIEIQEERVEWAKKRVPGMEVVCGDALKLPWPAEHFDLVVCIDVFEHIPHDDQHTAAAEIARVLKPSGCGFAAVPNRFQLMDEHNKILFGSWMPVPLRRACVRLFSPNKSFDRCYERSGRGWQALFNAQRLEVKIVPTGYLCRLVMPPSRYNIFMKKQV